MGKIIVKKVERYSDCIKLRNKWIRDLDEVLESSQMNILKKSFMKEFLGKKPEKMSSVKYNQIKSTSKQKFRKYNFILKALKDEEQKDTFGFKDIKKQPPKATPYILTQSTLKSLLDDLRKK